MKQILIEKNQIIPAGNYLVHIGTYNTTDIALISKKSGETVRFEHIRKKGVLRNIKRHFKSYFSSSEEFYFNFMHEDKVKELITMLKS